TGKSAALLHPRALILATGARERVQPRAGWTLAGVTTAGALQSALKTTAEPPAGRVLLAGSGPLLLATGAELVRLGAPPVAIIEAGRPFAHPFSALRLPLSYLTEAAGYLARLKAARVPILTGHHLIRISADGPVLVAHIDTQNGATTLIVDRIGLHDGIAPNDLGVPDCPAIPVMRLGDCREALGARAALADGRAGGARMAALLVGESPNLAASKVDKERAAQSRLTAIYAHDGRRHLADLPTDTVLCRCENRTLADLRALGDAPTIRQLRLDGRFGMGACQGRFCAEWVGRLAQSDQPPVTRLGANRWPVRPFSISDLVDAPEEGFQK
ncbi:MAG: oxidase, partial [Paracoccaceae bacterium]|nr:oxidase [Paracoccaceae bacterium]